jgi:hypothetical protein
MNLERKYLVAYDEKTDCADASPKVQLDDINTNNSNRVSVALSRDK